MNKLLLIKSIFWTILLNSAIFMIFGFLFSTNTRVTTITKSQGPNENENVSKRIYLISYERKTKKYSLEGKYILLGGKYYSENIQPFLLDIEKVLKSRKVSYDSNLIKGMFYIGQQESHWTPSRISSAEIAGGHPTGIFQFLPGTFSSVSDGDIFNPYDQIDAFIVMVERGRILEFGPMYSCNYEPCLSDEIKEYLINYN